jgi:HlyD family secretion protein
MTKRQLYIGALLLLTAAAAISYATWKSRKPVTAYRLAKIERGPITASVSATGTLNPVVSVQVGSQVSGQIKELYVDYNSQVKKGQLIARIDPESFALRVGQATADIEAARASVLTQFANVGALRAEVSRARVSLGDAERDFQRNKALFEKNFVSASAFDKARAVFEGAQEQLKIAQAQLAVGESQVRNVEAVVKQRQSQLSQAKVDLDRTEIRAPVDGIVVKKSVEPGQTVAASLQSPELFVIAQDLREMQVETSIDEAEVGRIRVGQSATFTVDSFPGKTFRGTVSQVRKAAQVVQNVVTYIAVIATSNADLSLFPGMTANVRIVVDSRNNALKVSNAALRFRPAGTTQARQPEATTAPEATAGKGGAQQRSAQARERLIKDLGLNAEQQAKVETIFSDTRSKIRALNTEDQAERRRQADRLRAESRARIAEILNPGQRKRYEEMNASRAAGGVTSGRVWTLDESGNPQAVNLRLGLTDGTYSEAVSGGVTEGMEVIVGIGDSGKARTQPARGMRFGL